MKKATVLALLGLFIAPSIASAAWWNPFAWKKTPEAVKEVATSTTATTTLALPSVEELYKRIAELEQKLDDARQNMKSVVEISTKAKAETPAVVSGPAVSDKEISSKVRASVVLVETATTSGGALIIDAQGHILTNASSVWTKDNDGYVVGASTEANIVFSNGSKKKATLVGIDEAANLAVLQLTDKKSSSYIAPSYDSITIGDTLYLFGFSSEQSNTKGSFVSGAVAQKTSSSIQITTEIKPLENGGFVITKNRGLVATLNTSNCKVLEEMSKCLKYNVTANILSSARVQKLLGGMKLYKNKQNRTVEETLFRGFFDGIYNTVNQSGAIDYAIDNATGRNSFDYFNNKLADDKDSKVTKIYLNKLKTTATNIYQAFDLLKSLTYSLHVSFINEESSLLKLDSYQRKIANQINAENEIRLKDYQAKVAVWAKKKSEYDSYILRPSDVTHDYLMAEGVSVENAAEYLKKERQKLLDSFSGETVNIY